MPSKSEEDKEVERRVRGHVRQEMVKRRLGVNEAGRRLGLGQGSLSKILNETRGIGPGFILRVIQRLHVPATLLLEEDPPEEFLKAGIPDIDEDEGRTEGAAPRRRKPKPT